MTRKASHDVTSWNPLPHSGAVLNTETAELPEAVRHQVHDSCPESYQKTEADGPTPKPFQQKYLNKIRSRAKTTAERKAPGRDIFGPPLPVS